jgi:hypothetical protein
MVSGKENKALDSAAEIAMDEIEKAALEDAREASKEKEAPKGSFERFMGSMGDRSRWAG